MLGATHQAVVALGHTVQQQAYFLAFSDAFALLGVGLAAAVVATLLLKRTGHVAAGGGALTIK